MKYLVAVDGSAAADAAFKKAVSLSKADDEVITLCVTDLTHYILSQPLSVQSDIGFDNMRDHMTTQGNEVITKYKGLAPENTSVFYTFRIENGNPREVILQIVLEQKVDILIVGQVGLTSTRSTSLGSTSEYCIRNCPCDVLICKSIRINPSEELW